MRPDIRNDVFEEISFLTGQLFLYQKIVDVLAERFLLFRRHFVERTAFPFLPALTFGFTVRGLAARLSVWVPERAGIRRD